MDERERRHEAAPQREHEGLRDRLELFRQLVENSQGLVCSHDLEGNLLYVSPASAWELGYTPEDGVGRNLREFLAPRYARSSTAISSAFARKRRIAACSAW